MNEDDDIFYTPDEILEYIQWYEIADPACGTGWYLAAIIGNPPFGGDE